MEMRPFVGVICWQRCSANYLCLELWPRSAVCNCAPASILTEFLGLKLHFFTYKSTEFFFFVLLWWRQFLITDCQNEEGRTIQLVLQHTFSVSTAPGWQQWHLFEQDSFGLEVCYIFSLAQGHNVKCVTWRSCSLLSSKSYHQSHTCFL